MKLQNVLNNIHLTLIPPLAKQTFFLSWPFFEISDSGPLHLSWYECLGIKETYKKSPVSQQFTQSGLTTDKRYNVDTKDFSVEAPPIYSNDCIQTDLVAVKTSHFVTVSYSSFILSTLVALQSLKNIKLHQPQLAFAGDNIYRDITVDRILQNHPNQIFHIFFCVKEVNLSFKEFYNYRNFHCIVSVCVFLNIIDYNFPIISGSSSTNNFVLVNTLTRSHWRQHQHLH